MNLFKSRSRVFAEGARRAGPSGCRLYAVGDVHGRPDLLDRLLAGIEEDMAAREAKDTYLVFLGDLIDRGPGSAQVVERLRTYAPDGVRCVFLLGNHEEVLLRLLAGEEELLRSWLKFGGAECAQSYGIGPRGLARRGEQGAVATLREAIPQDHIDFLSSFADTFRFGDYLLVHAGIRPGIEVSLQSQADLRWIRSPFLEDDRDHGFMVVHGHTISEQVEERTNRIGIDTGAYRTGVLTALAVEGVERWYVTTTKGVTDPEATPSTQR